MIHRAILALFLFHLSFFGFAQGPTSGSNPWQRLGAPNGRQALNKTVEPRSSSWKLDIIRLKQAIAGLETELSLAMPLPHGLADFRVRKSVVMSAELAAKYPSIKTFSGTHLKDPSITLRFDFTPKGFHGMIFTPEGIVYIDPEANGQSYKSYYRQDLQKKNPFQCQQHSSKPHLAATISSQAVHRGSRLFARSGEQLRKYRLAVTTTGEYANFHGGSVVDALSAIVITMNRVNGIYERELAVSMELIANTDALIYTNSATDPYTNGNPNTLISQVQATIDNIIGNENYDIGHGFSTGAGGLAFLGAVCKAGSKARGVTGTRNPVGDPFDVDFVAHEIGHQFGATHTFNGNTGACEGFNRIGATAFEPGSGTTIMAYAGICDEQNIQNNSNDYFHAASLDQMISYSTVGTGDICAVLSNTGNTPPEVETGEGGFYIPVSTPFRLEGSASDPDEDVLTYCWEQMDLGPAGNPNFPLDNAPLFRSFSPVEESYRIFPRLSNILNGTQSLGEVLPATARELNFRLTVRDNRAGGGGINHADIGFQVTDEAGPFVITSQNEASAEVAQQPITVTWDVANTDKAPVSCQAVNILLSVDGGLSFPHVLASNVGNDGSETVVLPNLLTAEARIKVEAVGNVFFDISDQDFSISQPIIPDFFLVANIENNVICAPQEAGYDIVVGSVLGFDTPVALTVDALPDGLETSLSSNQVTPGDTTLLTISNTGSASGEYLVTIRGTDGTDSREVTLQLNMINGAPEAVSIEGPVNNASNIDLLPTFSWNTLGENVTYQFQVAEDPAFSNVIASDSGIVSNTFGLTEPLQSNRQYFWRVRASNVCATNAYTEATFRTVSVSVVEVASTEVPKAISDGGPNTIVSNIEISIPGTIYDINVIDLVGEHTWLEDLRVTLTSPGGTEILLFANLCFLEDDFNLQLDDQSPLSHGAIPCPATDGGTYQPSSLLSGFNGEQVEGIWTLTIEDQASNDGGQLLSWSLQVSVLSPEPPAPLAPTILSAALVSPLQIDLQWKDNSSDETSFIIERSQSDNNSFREIATIDANSSTYQDQSLTERGNYYYRVKAVNSGGSSLYSNEVMVILPPATPTNLTATLLTRNETSLDWEDNSGNETGFVVERAVKPNSVFEEIATLEENIITFQDEPLEDPGAYLYRVKAINAAGSSDYSNEVEVTVVVGLHPKVIHRVSLYPNPVDQWVQVTLDNIYGTVNLTIADPSGRTVLRHNLHSSGSPTAIDLTGLAKGLYFVIISNSRLNLTQKLIKR